MGCFSPDPPPAPDYASAAAAGVTADIDSLPIRRQIEAAAASGGKYTDPATGKVYDFTGTGNAEMDAAHAERMAQAMKDIQEKFGPDFIKNALDQEKLADPTGVAMRQKLADLINTQSGQTVDTSTNEALQRQIRADLDAGGNLSDDVRREVEQEVLRNQTATGNVSGNSAMFSRAMEMGNEATRRRTLAQQKALAFLTSGATPQDVEYRRGQQNMGNMGSFLSGQTPEAQFGQLSGASQGAAPFVPAKPLSNNVNPVAGPAATNFAQQNYGQGMNYAMNTVNDWVTGLMIGGKFVGEVAGGVACWVAREVFGEGNPEWLMFRAWLFGQAPAWFRWLYLRHGERFAAWIHNKPRLKAVIRRWMRARIKLPEAFAIPKNCGRKTNRFFKRAASRKESCQPA